MRTEEQNQKLIEKYTNRLKAVKREFSLFNALINREVGTLQLKTGKNLQESVQRHYNKRIHSIEYYIKRIERDLQQQ